MGNPGQAIFTVVGTMKGRCSAQLSVWKRGKRSMMYGTNSQVSRPEDVEGTRYGPIESISLHAGPRSVCGRSRQVWVVFTRSIESAPPPHLRSIYGDRHTLLYRLRVELGPSCCSDDAPKFPAMPTKHIPAGLPQPRRGLRRLKAFPAEQRQLVM